MTHRFALPTDAEIEKLITQVYESLPYPDQSRLSLIESSLLAKAKNNKSQNKLNKIPWWIVFVLAGSFATAAWWVGEIFSDAPVLNNNNQSAGINKRIFEKRVESNKEESVLTEKSESDKYNEHEDSPIIYQRESF